MTRVAQCHCGQVKITCKGEPRPVVMCSCQLCQRRTGSLIHIGAWFAAEDVQIDGETKAFTRTTGDLGIEATFNFCPNCGTSIWWPGHPAGLLAGRIGVAGGCFADPEFPLPTVAIYDKRRHPWVPAPEGTPCFMDMPPIEEIGNLFR
jgi:hypothetical protein